MELLVCTNDQQNALLQELVKRSLLKMMCRKLSIYNVTWSCDECTTIVMESKGITYSHWKDGGLQMRVPENLIKRTFFIEDEFEEKEIGHKSGIILLKACKKQKYSVPNDLITLIVSLGDFIKHYYDDEMKE